MSSQPRVAAVIVTHNSENFLGQTLRSIEDQSHPAQIRIAVDDHSSDATSELLSHGGFTVVRATSAADDITTRIAQNFHQALREAVEQGADLVVIGDHDDVWHRDRIEYQVALLQQHTHIAMLASDGFLIDQHGAAVPGTIRSNFPVPSDFNSRTTSAQLRYALRHSIATGGACALRPAALSDWAIPAGWLHDRWWSLVALRAGRLWWDPSPVIDYRVSSSQQVGLDTAQQQAPGRWLVGKAQRFGSSASRVRDLSRMSGRSTQEGS